MLPAGMAISSTTRSSTTRRAASPCKLNPFLELVRRRPDGYHDIDTIMVAVDWVDDVTLTLRNAPALSAAPEIRVRCDWAADTKNLVDDPERRDWSLPQDADNLVHKALAQFHRSLQIHIGCPLKVGYHVCIEKRVPSGAGLGGASSNAATALRLAADAVAAEYSISPVHAAHTARAAAARVGSDVVFFLGQTKPDFGPIQAARCTGRGENVEAVMLTNHVFSGDIRFLIVHPPESVSTADVYRQCEVPQHSISAVEHYAGADAVSGSKGRPLSIDLTIAPTRNRLTAPARQLSRCVDRLLSIGERQGLPISMTGSGSACFAILTDADSISQAERWRTLLPKGCLSTIAGITKTPQSIQLE
ncbi:MAG: hypothetical protein AAF958_09620 [Planctomycetota bacterium]